MIDLRRLTPKVLGQALTLFRKAAPNFGAGHYPTSLGSLAAKTRAILPLGSLITSALASTKYQYHALDRQARRPSESARAKMLPIQLKQRRQDAYSFHQEYRTRWSDNDMYDHMNNSIYSFLFDSIINSYLIEHCGHNPATSPQIGLVVSSNSNYFGSVGFPSIVDLGLRVNKLGTSSVTYEVGLFQRGHKIVRAVGEYTHVFVERETNRPATSGMPEEIRGGLEKLIVDEKPKL